MSELFIGAGTVLNVGTVLIGSAVGALLGERLPDARATSSPTGSAWSPCSSPGST